MSEARIEDLAFLSGEWRGDIGPISVEENFSTPTAGSIEARVKLMEAGAASTIELIRFAECADGGLMVHVRQFSPALELRVSEDLKLVSSETGLAIFEDMTAQSICRLTYTLVADDVLTVQVTFPGEQSVTAELKRVG